VADIPDDAAASAGLAGADGSDMGDDVVGRGSDEVRVLS
jgi:hypothetical protein